METIEDIIHIHEKIIKFFIIEKGNHNVYATLIQILTYQVLNSTVPYGITNEKDLIINLEYSPIKKKIEEYTFREYKNMCDFILEIHTHITELDIKETSYVCLSADILNKHKDYLDKPQTSTFMGKNKQSIDKNMNDNILKYHTLLENMKENNLMINYQKLDYYLKKFKIVGYTLFNPFELKTIQTSYKQAKKNNKKNYYCECFEKGEDSNGNVVCKNCGSMFNDIEESINYHDYSRVNIVQKYHYEKRCHFRDTINQFQGKQNKYIPQKVYDDITYMIKMHGLSIDKITLHHISMFLTETKNSKFYEDKQLIYSTIVGKEKPDISKYEKGLYEDFDKLVTVFLKIKGERKNFLNAHYILKQLLLRQGVRLPEDALNSLKTPARLREHDQIYERCCDILGWNFTPLA